MQLFSDWSWKDWMLRSNWKGFSALAEVSISWDVFQRSGGLSFFFLWRTLMIMKIVVEVKVFILIYLNQSHSTAISICDNVHQTLTGRNFGEKNQAFFEKLGRQVGHGGGSKSKTLRLHAFWFFFWVQNLHHQQMHLIRPPMTEAWKPDRHVIAKLCREWDLDTLDLPKEARVFFRVFEWKKKGGLLTLEWNEKVAKKKRSPGIMTHVFGPTTMKNWVESSESSESFESAKMIFKSPTKKCSVFQNFQVCRRLHLFFLLQPDHQAARRTDIIWVFVSSSLRGPMPSETRWAKFEDRSRKFGEWIPPKMMGLGILAQNMAIFSIYLQFLGVGLTHSNQI